MVNPQVTIGDTLAGKYRVDRELGAGGMGVVYAAWHLELDHPVAIKVVTAQVAALPAATVRFRREVRAAAKIRSEHVARVLDVGTLDNSLPYMVLELLEGNDLDQELTRRGRLPIVEAVDYLLQAIEAIAEAHAAGIVHRDLKPANLFLAERADKTRIIKVLDFGISKSLLAESAPGHVSLTQTGMMMGSPLYMSPEQMQSGRDADARCDVWALGVVLYQLLTGTTPFRGNSIVELCAAIFGGSPTSLGELRPDVPVALEQAISKCLERDRQLRHRNVAELAASIVNFGSPESRIHCERAMRVLDPTGTLRSSLNPLMAVTPLPSQADTRRQKEDAIRASALLLEQSPGTSGSAAPSSVSAELSAMPHGTHVSWNSTNRLERDRGRGRNRAYLLIGAVVVLLGPAALYFGVRKGFPGVDTVALGTVRPDDGATAAGFAPSATATTASSRPSAASPPPEVTQPPVVQAPNPSAAPEVIPTELRPVSAVAPRVANRAAPKAASAKSSSSNATSTETRRTATETSRDSSSLGLPDYGGRR